MYAHDSMPSPVISPTLWAWAQPSLSPCERLTLLALIHHADARGGSRVTLGYLSLFAGISKRSASSTTAALRERGLLAIEPQARGKHGSNASVYRVLAPQYDR